MGGGRGYPLAGNVFLNRGWQTFAHARGLQGSHTIHFKHVGVATLFVKIFGEDDRHLRCYPKGNGSDNNHLSDDDGTLRGELALGNDYDISDSSDASSEGSMSDDDYDAPPRRRAQTKEESAAPRCRAPPRCWPCR